MVDTCNEPCFHYYFLLGCIVIIAVLGFPASVAFTAQGDFVRMALGCCGTLCHSAALSSPLIGIVGCLKSIALGIAYLLGTLVALGTSFLVLSGYLGASSLMKLQELNLGWPQSRLYSYLSHYVIRDHLQLDMENIERILFFLPLVQCAFKCSIKIQFI